MDKTEIVKKFYESGILVSPKELRDLSEEEINRILETGKKESADKKNLSISLPPDERKRRVSAQDFIDYYNSKYEKIKGMLLKRMDVVSITNAGADPSPCGIIGIVKEMTQAGFILEDTTGEIEVIKSGISELEKINPDDVFGLKGFVRENKFFPKEIVWPDIPFNRRIGRIEGMSVVLSKKIKEGMERDCDFVISEDQPKSKNGIKINKNPEWINIAKNQDTIAILAFKTNNATKDDALFYLKKRSLPEPNPIKSMESSYIIEEIPDIFWLIQECEWAENHKGITIVSSGSQSFARVNLETRAVEFGKI